MGLRDRYKAVKYLNAMEESGKQAVNHWPDGSPEEQFYIGVVLAIQEKLGDRRQPPSNPQEFLDSMNSALGWGWLKTTLFVDRFGTGKVPEAPYTPPNPPTPEQLATWGRPKMPKTVLHESLDGMQRAIDIATSGIELGTPEALSVSEQLDSASGGFGQLLSLGVEPQAIIKSLAADSLRLATAMNGPDRDEAAAAASEAFTSLVAARGMLK